MNTLDNKIKDDLVLLESMALQRTIMANQRTLLAYLRTSMYFLIAGLSISHLMKLSFGLPLEILLFSFSGVLFITGIFHYRKQQMHIASFEQQIRERI